LPPRAIRPTVVSDVRAVRPKLYGLVSDESQTAVQWFTDLEAAEKSLRGVLADEPDWRGVVRIAEFELTAPRIHAPLFLN
jgi:uncharacterized protein YegJ (DUF2314 family)